FYTAKTGRSKNQRLLPVMDCTTFSLYYIVSYAKLQEKNCPISVNYALRLLYFAKSVAKITVYSLHAKGGKHEHRLPVYWKTDKDRAHSDGHHARAACRAG